MKKMFLLSMLSLMFITEMNYAGEVRSLCPPQDHPWINLKIIFHRPKFDCMRGFGICLIFTGGFEEKSMKPGEQGCAAKGRVNGKGQLVIEVTVNELTAYESGSTLPYFQEKQSLSILDPYTLTDEMCKSLGVAQGYTIKPGSYPVAFSNGVYIIIF